LPKPLLLPVTKTLLIEELLSTVHDGHRPLLQQRTKSQLTRA